MKRNKKGFTLVELVIVIAVIAILAGVMIAIFSGVIKRANENAELQQVKNDELKQKAEDVLTKLDNANWFSWEDFENSLAAKLEKTYEKYANTSAGVTSEQLEKVVKKALEEYGANLGQSNTSLTETQVKAIVENAIAKASLGGVTENQVRTIVNTAVGSINTVSKADIQRIVDAAINKQLTAADIAKVITDAELAKASTVAEINTAVTSILSKLETLQSNALTKDDVSEMIKKLLPVTDTVTTVAEFNYAVANWNSGSTIVIDKALVDALAAAENDEDKVLTLTTDDTKTLTIKGVDIDKLTVNAPNATIYVVVGVDTVKVESVALNSLHLLKDVKTLNVTKGRVVVESGVAVKNIDVNSEGLGDKVIIVIEKEAKVTELLNVTAAEGSVAVENKGVINQVLAEDDVPAGKSQVVNTDGGVVTKLAESDDGNATGLVIISGDNTPKRSVVVTNETELNEALTAVKEGTAYKDVEAGKLSTIIFGNDISATADVSVDVSVTIDGNGHTLNTTSKNGILIEKSNASVVVKNMRIEGSSLERAIQVNENCDNVTLNILNITTTTTRYAINICNNSTCYLTIEDSTITGWAAINTWAKGYLMTIKNSVLSGINVFKKGSNDFATICLEGDTTRLTDMHSSNNVVNIENTKIVAEAKNTAYQYLIGFNTGSENNIVTLTDCELVLDGTEKTFLMYDLGDNKMTAAESTFNGEGFDYEYFLPKNVLWNGEEYNIKKALAKASSGDTIKLITNVDSPLVITNGKNVVIDLNGFTITNDNTNSDTINVYSTATVVICDSSNGEKGSVVSNDGSAIWSGHPATDESVITINDGVKLVGKDYGVNVTGGKVTVTINNATITGEKGDYAVNDGSTITDNRAN